VEQIAIAAMDLGDKTTAQKYYSILRTKFGQESTRILRLKGLYQEFNKEFEQANRTYDDLLKKEPTDTVAMKRKIAVIKETQPARAIELLNEYLSVFMADTDAWAELGDIYLSLQQYSHACYCYEELILATPQNYHLYVKYAEIKYTMGGATNIQEALKYYSLALELSKENNLRAYYGLIMAVNSVVSFRGKEISKESQDAVNWAIAELRKFYEKAQPSKSPIISNWLKELRLPGNE